MDLRLTTRVSPRRFIGDIGSDVRMYRIFICIGIDHIEMKHRHELLIETETNWKIITNLSQTNDFHIRKALWNMDYISITVVCVCVRVLHIAFAYNFVHNLFDSKQFSNWKLFLIYAKIITIWYRCGEVIAGNLFPLKCKSCANHFGFTGEVNLFLNCFINQKFRARQCTECNSKLCPQNSLWTHQAKVDSHFVLALMLPHNQLTRTKNTHHVYSSMFYARYVTFDT